MISYAEAPDGALYQGDVLDVLRELPSESIHCVVTSPPYWGLRDYRTAQWEGGDPKCKHFKGNGDARSRAKSTIGYAKSQGHNLESLGDFCRKCGSRRIDAQLGLEATPEEYIAKLIEVFREVHRVLRKDGTLWLNLGSSYAGGGNYAGWEGKDIQTKQATNRASSQLLGRIAKIPPGFKPKDLIPIPWMVAMALQADGWWLRSDIIWAKPNPMPESIIDRPTKSHEYLFLLTRAERYFYDADAIREPHIDESLARYLRGSSYNGSKPYSMKLGPSGHGAKGRKEYAPTDGGAGTSWQGHSGYFNAEGEFIGDPSGRNKRTVWEIAAEPYAEAHFATFPQKLIEPCVLAGTSEYGCCAECRAPWERIVEKKPSTMNIRVRDAQKGRLDFKSGLGGARYKASDEEIANYDKEELGFLKTIGWQPACPHPNAPRVPCTVLDPFIGSGTTALVARKLGRRWIGIDLNADYLRLAQLRIEAQALPLPQFEGVKA